jgi:putative addiction module CopG family antidote
MMTVHLDERFTPYIEEQVKSGRFATPEDVIEDALMRMLWRQNERANKDVAKEPDLGK